MEIRLLALTFFTSLLNPTFGNTTTSKQQANDFLKSQYAQHKAKTRQQRSNSGLFEESIFGEHANFERECVQERCTSDELIEAASLEYEKGHKRPKYDKEYLKIFKIKTKNDYIAHKRQLIYNKCYINFELAKSNPKKYSKKICSQTGSSECKNIYNNYKCICLKGFTGKHCQFCDENVYNFDMKHERKVDHKICSNGQVLSCYEYLGMSDLYSVCRSRNGACSCEDIDECGNAELNVCDVNEECVNRINSGYFCRRITTTSTTELMTTTIFVPEETTMAESETTTTTSTTTTEQPTTTTEPPTTTIPTTTQPPFIHPCHQTPYPCQKDERCHPDDNNQNSHTCEKCGDKRYETCQVDPKTNNCKCQPVDVCKNGDFSCKSHQICVKSKILKHAHAVAMGGRFLMGRNKAKYGIPGVGNNKNFYGYGPTYGALKPYLCYDCYKKKRLLKEFAYCQRNDENKCECSDINECLENSFDCDANQACANKFKSGYYCKNCYALEGKLESEYWVIFEIFF